MVAVGAGSTLAKLQRGTMETNFWKTSADCAAHKLTKKRRKMFEMLINFQQFKLAEYTTVNLFNLS